MARAKLAAAAWRDGERSREKESVPLAPDDSPVGSGKAGAGSRVSELVDDLFATGEEGSAAEAGGAKDGLAALGLFGAAAGALVLLGCVAAFACYWSRRGGGDKGDKGGFKSAVRLTVRRAMTMDSSLSDSSLPPTPPVLEKGRSNSMNASLCAAPPAKMNKEQKKVSSDTLDRIRRTSERLSSREESPPVSDESHSDPEEHSPASIGLHRKGVGGSLSKKESLDKIRRTSERLSGREEDPSELEYGELDDEPSVASISASTAKACGSFSSNSSSSRGSLMSARI